MVTESIKKAFEQSTRAAGNTIIFYNIWKWRYKMDQTDIATKEFNVNGCRARHRTSEVADCLSHTDIFIFCPFVLYFGGEKFCCHPNRDEIIAQTEKLLNS